jgi:hypothetical protein
MREYESENNTPVNYDRQRAELNLVDLSEGAQAVVAMSQEQDAAEAAKNEARRAKQARLLDEIQSLQRTLSDARRMASHPNSDMVETKRAEKRVAQIEKAIATKKAALDAKPPRGKGTPPRRHTSRIMAVIAQNRPVRELKVQPSKKYSGANGLEVVREEIAALQVEIPKLYEARLPEEDAFARWKRTVHRQSDRADSVPFGEFLRVREGPGGSFAMPAIDIPNDIFIRAVESFVVALGEEKLRKLYDNLQLEADVRFLSIEDRRRELARIQKDIRALEIIEGELIRRAALAGESATIRGNMDIDALLGIEVDTSAPKKPKPQILEVPAGTPAHMIRPPLNR